MSSANAGAQEDGLDPEDSWPEPHRESILTAAGKGFDRFATRLGLSEEVRRVYLACVEAETIRRFPKGASELNAAPQGSMGAILEMCSGRWRDPIEASTTWDFTAAALFRMQCEESAWRKRVPVGVEPSEFCSCLAKNAQTAFANPADLWKIQRSTEPKKLPVWQKAAFQRMAKPCLELRATE